VQVVVVVAAVVVVVVAVLMRKHFLRLAAWLFYFANIWAANK
jgi:hypothetical protein